MSTPVLARRRRLLERPSPWLLFGFLASAGLVALAWFTKTGFLAEYEAFPAVLRGYSVVGVFFGVLATASVGLSAFYSVRKRWLQESMPVGRGTLSMWLWSHVVLGALALLLSILHAGYGVLSLQPTTGKALLFLLVFIVGSGVVWRIVYAWVPRGAAREVGNYSVESSLARAEACLVEIEKLAAGRSPKLRELATWVTTAPENATRESGPAAALDLSEQAVFSEIVRLSVERHASLERSRQKARYVSWLQGWRVVHTPISLLFLILLPLHVIFAYDVPERVLAETPGGSALGGFESASTCSRCHARVVEEWRSSMHAHALSSPIMIAQTNLAARTTLSRAKSPDPQQMCVNCHGPLAARIAPSATLPLETSLLGDPDLVHEGVTCVVCHAFQGDSETGSAALTAFQEKLVPGRAYFGAISHPVGNAFHKTERSSVFTSPERLCQNCHSVVYDRNSDGRIEKGTDLVLQDLFSEWEAYRASGGAHCVDCHMPVVAGVRAAESALMLFEQDEEAPARRLRSHRFGGPDFPLESPTLRDAGRAERQALLSSAAELRIEPGSARFENGRISAQVSVANVGSGHNLPGGFAFVRQMWIELKILDASGRLLASSGVLDSVSQDLCESSILAPGSALAADVVGCAAADPALVTFQQRLVDRIERATDSAGRSAVRAAPAAQEVIVQHLDGGSVPRFRVADGQAVLPLAPSERRTFGYTLSVPAGTRPAKVSARLMFRATPPYFLRALAKTQGPGDGPRVDGFLETLEILTMASASATLAP